MKRQITKLIALWATAATPLAAQAPRALTDSAFAVLVAQLSEPSGFFDTDNLISNEDAYLIPISALRKQGITGGTYVGVGPDQNFSYIAAVRPNVAFIVDIRRDNLLEHLLFKAIFAQSRGRVDYLALLFGRTPPPDTAGWSARPVDSLLAFIDRSRPDSAAASHARTRVLAEVRRSGVPLSAAELQTIARFHSTFIAAGPALRFNTFGRAPSPWYPDFRRLATERDADGRQASFLARETDFQVVKSLQDRNLLVPVTGNFAGTRALRTVGEWMRANGERLSVFYTSNVEQYLFRDGGFEVFAASVARLPRQSDAVMIRTCFVCANHPGAVSGYHVVPLVQHVGRFVELSAAGRLTNYSALLTLGLLTP